MQGEVFLAVESIPNWKPKYRTTAISFGKGYTNRLISHRFVVACKMPIIEALFCPSAHI